MDAPDRGQAGPAKLVYILYLVAILIPICALIGVVVAYVYRRDAPAWVASHYAFQIRTFWLGLILLVLSIILWIVLIGWLVSIAWIVWLTIRVVTGWRRLERGEPHPDPLTLLF